LASQDNVKAVMWSYSINTSVTELKGHHMSNESIELINYLKRYGLSNELFRKLHPAGIAMHEFQQLCIATEYFAQGSDDEITKLRLVFLRVTIRTDKFPSSITEDEFKYLAEAAIRGFPSSGGEQSADLDTGAYPLYRSSLH